MKQKHRDKSLLKAGIAVTLCFLWAMPVSCQLIETASKALADRKLGKQVRACGKLGYTKCGLFVWSDEIKQDVHLPSGMKNGPELGATVEIIGVLRFSPGVYFDKETGKAVYPPGSEHPKPGYSAKVAYYYLDSKGLQWRLIE